MRTQDQFLAASTFVIVGLVTLCVSLPLVYRNVRMNRFYGIRSAQSFVSEARWYDINEVWWTSSARCLKATSKPPSLPFTKTTP